MLLSCVFTLSLWYFVKSLELNLIVMNINSTTTVPFLHPFFPATIKETIKQIQLNYPQMFMGISVITVDAQITVSDMQLVDVKEPCGAMEYYGLQLLTELYGQRPELFHMDQLIPHPDTITLIQLEGFCAPLAKQVENFAASINVLVSGYTILTELSQNAAYPTSILLHPVPSSDLMAALKALLRRYSWYTIGIICFHDDHYYSDGFTCAYDLDNFFYNNDFASGKTYKPRYSIDSNYTELLLDMQQHSRVIMIRTVPASTRSLMIAAYNLNMTNGDYVFILFLTSPFHSLPDKIRWKAKDGLPNESSADDYKARKAFDRAYFIGDMDIDWSKMAPFFDAVILATGIPLDPDAKSDIEGLLTYESMMVFAEGIKRYWKPGMEPQTLTSRMLNQTYDLPSRRIYLRPDGLTTLTVPYYRFDPETGDLQIVGVYDADSNSIQVSDPELWLWGGSSVYPPDIPPCGFTGDLCTDNSLQFALMVSIPLVALVLILFISFMAASMLKRRSQRLQFSYSFTPSAQYTLLICSEMHGNGLSSAVLSTSAAPLLDHAPVSVLPLSESFGEKKLSKHRKFRKTVIQILALSHPNVGVFHRILVEPTHCVLCWEYSRRGALAELLKQGSILRDEKIRLSFLGDLIHGLAYIHGSALSYHGNLTANVCFIDARYTLKIGQIGLVQLRSSLGLERADRKLNNYGHSRVGKDQAEDIYMLGMLCQEIYTPAGDMNTYAILKWNKLIKDCCSSNDLFRPTMSNIKAALNLLRPPKTLVMHILKLLDKQTHVLEDLVAVKTQELQDETIKVDQLLAEMLPIAVIKQLRNKELIQPEIFDSVSIMFSDLPTFPGLVLHSTPLDIVALLNTIYSSFDNIVHLFDAYKVETISDSYMISSGVPERNDTRHAVQLCLLAIKLTDMAPTLRVPTAPEIQLDIRIGINSGSVVAGVIGSRMPRFCLFGDTVNTASRMESHGEAGRIHVNMSTYLLASSNHYLIFHHRGEVEIKGKGTMQTYWLTQ